jgi:hypothetical protein
LELLEYTKTIKKLKRVTTHSKSWGGDVRFFGRLTFMRPPRNSKSTVRLHGPGKNDKDFLVRKLVTEKIPHQVRIQGTYGFSFYLYINDVETVKWLMADPKYSYWLTEIAVSSQKYMSAYQNKPIEAYDVEFVDNPEGRIYHNKASKGMDYRLVLKVATTSQPKHKDQGMALGTLIDEQSENYRTSNESSLMLMRDRGFIVRNCIFYAVDLDHVLMAKMVAPDLITRIIKLERLNARKLSDDSRRKGRY